MLCRLPHVSGRPKIEGWRHQGASPFYIKLQRKRRAAATDAEVPVAVYGLILPEIEKTKNVRKKMIWTAQPHLKLLYHQDFPLSCDAIVFRWWMFGLFPSSGVRFWFHEIQLPADVTALHLDPIVVGEADDGSDAAANQRLAWMDRTAPNAMEWRSTTKHRNRKNLFIQKLIKILNWPKLFLWIGFACWLMLLSSMESKQVSNTFDHQGLLRHSQGNESKPG